MVETKKVLVRWFTPDEKGRLNRPTGKKYTAPVRFDDHVCDGEWSARLEAESLDEGDWFPGTLTFIAASAPFSSVKVGDKFYMFEGRWPVLEGEVIY